MTDHVSMWSEFAFATILGICGFLIKRSLDDIDDNQKEMNRKLYLQGDRLRELEKNQAVDSHKLDTLQKSIVFVDKSVKSVDKKVESYQDIIEVKVHDLDEMTRKNQESFGKIIVILKKLILKK